MATNSNSKSFFDLPVTTQLFYLVGFLWELELFLIFNPLTLFVLNIFKPRWARSMAHFDALYDKKSQKFFTEQAKKWPWNWAKYWYTREELKDLSEKRQIDYYYDVDCSAKTLAAMSSEASLAVIDDGMGKNFEEFKQNINGIKMSPELFRAFIQKSINEDDMSTLSDYLKRGTISKDLVECLFDEAGDFDNTWLASVFYDYVERCGLGQEMLKNLLARSSSAKFKEEVEKRQNIYSQRLFAKSQRGSKLTDAWLPYCKTVKEICPQAQMEMDSDQYHIFHSTGHHLDADAILHILGHNSDRTMAKLIFEYEPFFGMIRNDIKELVDHTPALSDLYQSVMALNQDDLNNRIYRHEKLTVAELDRVFSYLNAGDLIFEYITHYPLPEEMHRRLLTLPQKSRACILLYHSYEIEQPECSSEKFHLADDVREECIKRGWLREK